MRWRKIGLNTNVPEIQSKVEELESCFSVTLVKDLLILLLQKNHNLLQKLPL